MTIHDFLESLGFMYMVSTFLMYFGYRNQDPPKKTREEKVREAYKTYHIGFVVGITFPIVKYLFFMLKDMLF